jgi:hypothetical protein
MVNFSHSFLDFPTHFLVSGKDDSIGDRLRFFGIVLVGSTGHSPGHLSGHLGTLQAIHTRFTHEAQESSKRLTRYSHMIHKRVTRDSHAIHTRFTRDSHMIHT